ncbi:MAG: hypothetical protein BBJ60_03665 [Desulfobacterales bacterium S7086C20]|nr:MAG: hypothetical protein BBJ60_03665 [Desulfobacterales bacterium S7086C20]
MNTTKRSFFYFPTWTLILISILFCGATLFDIYLIFNLESFESITVNGTEYFQGSEQYKSGIKTMKQSFGGSALVTMIISLATGWFGYKRIKNKKGRFKFKVHH